MGWVFADLAVWFGAWDRDVCCCSCVSLVMSPSSLELWCLLMKKVQFELNASLNCRKQVRREKQKTHQDAAGTPSVLSAHPHTSVCAGACQLVALWEASQLYSLQPWCGRTCTVYWNCNYPCEVGVHSHEEFLLVCWDFANAKIHWTFSSSEAVDNIWNKWITAVGFGLQELVGL